MSSVINSFAFIIWSMTALASFAYVQHVINYMRGYAHSAFGPERIPYHGNVEQLKQLRSWAALLLLASFGMLAIVMYFPGRIA